MDVRLFGQRLEVDLLRRKLRKTQEQLKGLEFSHKEMEVECYKTKATLSQLEATHNALNAAWKQEKASLLRDAQVAEESLRRSRKNCQELALERDQLKRQLLDSAQRENYVTSQLLESHAAFRQLHEANQLNLSLKLDKDKLTTQLNQLTVRLEAQRGLEDANTALQNEILSLKALLERRAELGGDGIEGQQRVEGGTARLTSDEGGAPRREDITPGTTRSGMQQEIINNEEKITRNATEEKGRGQETPQVGQVQTAGPNRNK